MNADRERQRERLADLIAPRIVSGRETTLNIADHLIDNGVSVELPPEPVIAPGTTGTGRPLWGADRIRMMRTEPGWVAADGEGFSPEAITDFIADPAPLTAEAVEEVADRIQRRQHDAAIVILVREALAPYVAGGPR